VANHRKDNPNHKAKIKPKALFNHMAQLFMLKQSNNEKTTRMSITAETLNHNTSVADFGRTQDRVNIIAELAYRMNKK
jgi:hypothetical protein